MALTQKTRMKKSSASSDQPRKQATNVRRCSGLSRLKGARNCMAPKGWVESSREMGTAGSRERRAAAGGGRRGTVDVPEVAAAAARDAGARQGLRIESRR